MIKKSTLLPVFSLISIVKKHCPTRVSVCFHYSIMEITILIVKVLLRIRRWKITIERRERVRENLGRNNFLFLNIFMLISDQEHHHHHHLIVQQVQQAVSKTTLCCMDHTRSLPAEQLLP